MCVLYIVFDEIVKVRECRMRLEQGRASEICKERCKRLGRVDPAPCILSDPANKNWVGGSLVGPPPNPRVGGWRGSPTP